MKFFAQLKGAILERLGSLPATLATSRGRILFNEDGGLKTARPFLDDGTSLDQIMLEKHLPQARRDTIVLPDEGGTGYNIAGLFGQAGQVLVVNPGENGYIFGAGGGGGGAVTPETEIVLNQSGDTVTFSVLTYTFGDVVGFYRNGVRMRLVATFSTGSCAADEYMQINGGAGSNQFLLNPNTPATIDEWFLMEIGTASGTSSRDEAWGTFIVGPAASIPLEADYATIQAAHDAVGYSGQAIVLSEAYDGTGETPITLTKRTHIQGLGANTTIPVTVTIANTADGTSIAGARFAEDVTVDDGASCINLSSNLFMATGKNLTDNNVVGSLAAGNLYLMVRE